MDYCTCTLDDIIKMDTPIWFKMRVARQLTAGLDALFERSILHRDLKPKNILITGNKLEDYQVRITDFGLAKRLDPTELIAKSSVGTPLYMAPEILANKDFTQQVDIWALGCLIYTLFTKRPPFDAKSLPHLVDMLRKGTYFIPKGTKIPFEAIQFIDRCLKTDESKRKPTYELLLEDFLTHHDERRMTKAKILDF